MSRKSVYPNGLTLVSEQQRGLLGLSLGAWVRTGTRYEKRKEAGIAHFLEHMAFKGTTHRSAIDIVKQIEHVGGEFNASTYREATSFEVKLLNEHVKLGAEILSDILLNSLFDAKELEIERKVILQEIYMVEDDPEELAFDYFFEKVFGHHGLGRNILGSRASVKRISRQDLLRFYFRYYRPEKVVISVAGDVQHEVLYHCFKKLGSRAWPNRGKLAHPQTQQDKDARFAPVFKQGQWWEKRATEQCHIVWGVEGLPVGSEDRYECSLLNVLLGGGMSSILFQEIREKRGLAYTVYSFDSPFLDSGAFTIYAATDPRKVGTCLKIIENSVEKVCSELLSLKELRTLKNSVKGELTLSGDDSEGRMTNNARSEIFLNRILSLSESLKRIERITASDLRRVAQKLFRNKKRGILLLGPRPSKVDVSAFSRL